MITIFLSLVTDQFLVRPPTTFTVMEGNNVTLPCIANNDTTSWSYEGTGVFNSSDFGTVFVTPTTISIVSVGRTAQGILVCTSDEDGLVATTNLTVLGE